MNHMEDKSIILTKHIKVLDDYLSLIGLVVKKLKVSSILMLQLYESPDINVVSTSDLVEVKIDEIAQFLKSDPDEKHNIDNNEGLQNNEDELNLYEDELNLHEDMHNEPTKLSENKVKKTCAKEDRFCEPCNKEFATRHGFMTHVRDSHIRKLKIYNCNYCNKEFKFETYKKFTNHKLKCRTATLGKTFLCTQCGKYYSSDWSLKHHIKKIHERSLRIHVCPFCKTEIKALYHKKLTKHIESCAIALKPEFDQFECDKCHRRHPSQDIFEEHRRTCLQRAPPKPYQQTKYPCDFDGCDFVTKNKLNLQNHKNEKHLNLPRVTFQCEHCERSFSKKFLLNEHTERIHLNIIKKPYMCPECGSSFSKTALLKEHMLIHSDKLSYFCKYCAKGFKQKAVIYRHELKCPLKT